MAKIAITIDTRVTEEKTKPETKKSDGNNIKLQQLALQAQQTFRNDQMAAEQQAAQFREEVKLVAESLAVERKVIMVKLVSR